MIFGFDWAKTITSNQKQLTVLAKSLSINFQEIVIISAISYGANEDFYRRDVASKLKQLGFPYKKLHIINVMSDDLVPEKKLEVALREGVEIYFDDREDVCALFVKNGIAAMQVHNYFPPKELKGHSPSSWPKQEIDC